ncbi:hypothetical protein MMC25_007463 [Agyrium rufum]|nr:hypothetical protein [Agyrium rufum]
MPDSQYSQANPDLLFDKSQPMDSANGGAAELSAGCEFMLPLMDAYCRPLNDNSALVDSLSLEAGKTSIAVDQEPDRLGPSFPTHPLLAAAGDTSNTSDDHVQETSSIAIDTYLGYNNDAIDMNPIKLIDPRLDLDKDPAIPVSKIGDPAHFRSSYNALSTQNHLGQPSGGPSTDFCVRSLTDCSKPALKRNKRGEPGGSKKRRAKQAGRTSRSCISRCKDSAFASGSSNRGRPIGEGGSGFSGAHDAQTSAREEFAFLINHQQKFLELKKSHARRGIHQDMERLTKEDKEWKRLAKKFPFTSHMDRELF